MAHKLTYAALTATAVIAIVESQVQLLADTFTPAAYTWIIAAVAIARIAINAWKDWQASREH